jgi:flavin-dependent dehydrogenase
VTAVETAIVGGGPAGAAAAAGLARVGREVVLIERAAGPHHKVCGEFLGPVTLAQLGRLGIDPSGLGAVEIDRLALTASRTAIVPLPFRALSLSRYRLDEELLGRAAQAGAEVRQGIAVRAAASSLKGWRLRCSDGSMVQCRNLVLATGKWPVRGIANQRDRSLVGLKMHLQLAAATAVAATGRVELFLFAGGYAGLEPVEGGAFNLCLVLARRIAAGIGSGWPALADWLVATSPALGERLAGATACWGRACAVVCPTGGMLPPPANAAQAGLYPIGDRLAHIPPFAGDGLAIALASAELAVHHLRSGSASAAYFDEARRLTAPTIRRAAAMILPARLRAGRAVIAGAAAHAPGLIRQLALRTRIAAANRTGARVAGDEAEGVWHVARP